jgi:hypothetical protein
MRERACQVLVLIQAARSVRVWFRRGRARVSTPAQVSGGPDSAPRRPPHPTTFDGRHGDADTRTAPRSPQCQPTQGQSQGQGEEPSASPMVPVTSELVLAPKLVLPSEIR